MEVSGGSLVRLRINSTNGSGSTNAGVRLALSESNAYSLAAYDTGGGQVFQVYDEFNAINAIQYFNHANGQGTVREWEINGQTVPAQDNFYPIGKSALRWSAVWAVNGTIQTSDERFKRDVQDLKYGIREIMKLRPVVFNWADNRDERRHLGLIAQEVEKVLPEIIWRDEDPSLPLGMSYSDFVPVLVNAIQAQEKTLEYQQGRIAALEHQLQDQEHRIAHLEDKIGSEHLGSNSSDSKILFAGIPLACAAVLGRSWRRRNAKPAS